jgi:hypothetical protein
MLPILVAGVLAGSSARDALMALYEATSGGGWRQRGHWNTTAHPCRWHGITCSRGEVRLIDLGANGLRGTLPPSLSTISSLRVLNIDESRLSGTMPGSLASLTSLEVLLLAGNPRLSGTLPPSFDQLSGLVELDLSRTRISGNLGGWTGRLRTLRKLQLDHTELSGTVPPELGALTRLESLFLHESRHLSGTLPTALGELRVLRHGVSLAGTRLSGTLPTQLGMWTQLRQLWLVRASLSGSLPTQMGNLRHLNQLEVHGNRLSGRVPSQLSRLPLARCVLTNAQGPHQPRHSMRQVDAPAEDTNRFSCPLPSLPPACSAHLQCAAAGGAVGKRLKGRGRPGRGRSSRSMHMTHEPIPVYRPAPKPTIGVDEDNLAP